LTKDKCGTGEKCAYFTIDKWGEYACLPDILCKDATGLLNIKSGQMAKWSWGCFPKTDDLNEKSARNKV